MYKYINKLIILFCLLMAFNANVSAQIQIGNDMSEIDYSLPREYEIGGITVTGVKYLDPQVLVMISGLQPGETIEVPGDKITNAIRKLWEQGLFEDVSITCTTKIGKKIFLNIDLKERPRISKFSFKGVKKSEAEELRKKINLTRGDVATEHTYTKTTRIIEDYFYDKGFHNVIVDVQAENDTTRDNYVNIILDINKGAKVRISEIIIEGNEEFFCFTGLLLLYCALLAWYKEDDVSKNSVDSDIKITRCDENELQLDFDGEIISRKTIERCIDSPDSETYRIVVDGRKVGGVILKINKETNHNELEILFVSPEEHTKGIGYGAWLAVEALHPETEVWETCTPYFEKRNIHFYVNKCGFHIDEFWCEYFQPEHEVPGDEEHSSDEGPDEMFRFIKVMK